MLMYFSSKKLTLKLDCSGRILRVELFLVESQH
jgi:hypothetical protein